VTFVDAVNVKNNKVVFSADDRVLIKPLRQQIVYGAKKFIAEFSSNPWTLSGLIRWLLNTRHFEFWGDLTKVTVTIVSISKFN